MGQPHTAAGDPTWNLGQPGDNWSSSASLLAAKGEKTVFNTNWGIPVN